MKDRIHMKTPMSTGMLVRYINNLGNQAINQRETVLMASLILDQPQYPEDEWNISQIEEDERGEGCILCGDEEADTVRGLCFYCQ